MSDHVLLISSALQSRGPIPSGLMLEGAAHLAGALAAESYTPLVLDFNNVDTVRRIAEDGRDEFLAWALELLEESVRRHKTRLVGFTLYTNGFRDNVWLATELKRRCPGVLIAAGGPSVSWFKEEILDYTDAFDVIVTGKGDHAVVALADHVYRGEPLSKVPGAIWRERGEIMRAPRVLVKVDGLPIPIYDEAVYPFFRHKVRVSVLRSSLGCRYGLCTFCVQPRIDGRYRERNLDGVLREVEHLESRYGIRNFRMSDPNPSPEHLRELFARLPDGVRVGTFAYSDQGYDFKEARRNLAGLFIGIETLDPDTLRTLDKTSDPAAYVRKCRRMLAAAKRFGIPAVHANIVPAPNDTRARIRWEREQVAELQPDFITALAVCPIPGTLLHRQAVQQGDRSGIRLAPNFLRDLMLYELDLLRPSSTWAPPPWQVRVDGEMVENPFQLTGELFTEPLAADGIHMASDEIVLLASLYHDGLAHDQPTRREQVLGVQSALRDAVLEGQGWRLAELVSQMNAEPVGVGA